MTPPSRVERTGTGMCLSWHSLACHPCTPGTPLCQRATPRWHAESRCYPPSTVPRWHAESRSSGGCPPHACCVHVIPAVTKTCLYIGMTHVCTQVCGNCAHTCCIHHHVSVTHHVPAVLLYLPRARYPPSTVPSMCLLYPPHICYPQRAYRTHRCAVVVSFPLTPPFSSPELVGVLCPMQAEMYMIDMQQRVNEVPQKPSPHPYEPSPHPYELSPHPYELFPHPYEPSPWLPLSFAMP